MGTNVNSVPPPSLPSLTDLDTQPDEQLYYAKLRRSKVFHEKIPGGLYRFNFIMTLEWQPVPADHTAVRSHKAFWSHDKAYVIRDALESMYYSNGKLNVNEDIFYSRVVFWTTGQPEGFKNQEFSFNTREVRPPILFAKTFNDYVVERSMALLRYHTL